ncbi:hypothetical protein IT398_00585 [Candidatus Nomurabacteria bacterium]|nr:hypothetical protein [Candidatus Nomurabacteria bacterium]
MSKPTLDQAVRLLNLAQEKNISREQIQALFERGLLSDLLDGNMDKVNREQFRKILGLNTLPSIDWLATYRELGLNVPGAIINRDDDFWYIPVLEGVTGNLVIATLRRLGITCKLYTEDLDKCVIRNDRHPQNGAYTVKVARRVEADEEFKNLSADQLKEQNHSGITLLEYLLLFLGYYVTTKECLDTKNWTLCSGSSYSDGGVPSASWDPDSREFYVGWTPRGHARDSLRSREAVSG